MVFNNEMTESIKHGRKCGVCSERKIPFGVDWPWWKEGKPVCIACNKDVWPPLPNMENDEESPNVELRGCALLRSPA